jgi:hypothetical protein
MHNLTEDEIRELTVVKPKKIRLETTSVCQLKCPACPMTPMEMIDKVGYLKIDTFKKVIHEKVLSTIYLAIPHGTGGEGTKQGDV